MNCINENGYDELVIDDDMVGKHSTALCIVACGSVCALAWQVGGIYVASMSYAIGL